MNPTQRLRRAPLLAAACLLHAAAANAQLLRVGPGQSYEAPSAAAAVAQPGDTVLIAPGTYTDCATWRTPNVTIAAEGGGPVILQGPVCGQKALLVAAAPGITVQGITFRGATAPPGNGAGIRAEGGNLTVRNSRFEGNETGILAAPMPQATILVEDSVFVGNGNMGRGGLCSHGIYVNALARLSLSRTRIEGTRICHHVKSRAGRTEIRDSQLLDTADSRVSYLVDVPNGGDLVLERSLLRKGPNTGNSTTAVAIGFEGVRNPTRELRIRENRFESLLSVPTTFVSNRTDVAAEVTNNRLRGDMRALAGPGAVR